MKHAGILLEKYMTAENWSQRHLAEEVRVGQTTISKIILNQGTIGDELAIRIADVLKMSSIDKKRFRKQIKLDRLARELKRLEKKYERVLKNRILEIKIVDKDEEQNTISGKC